MEWTILIFVGAIATGASWTSMTRLEDRQTPTILLSAAALGLWILFAIGATNVTFKKGTCCVYTESYSGLALMGIAAALIMLLFFLNAIMVAFSDQEEDMGPLPPSQTQ